MNPKFLTFTDKAAMSLALSGAIEDMLDHALSHHKNISLLLSGGSTPKDAYSQLSKADLNWENIDIGLVDERWVDEDDTGSNAAMIRRTLLTNRAKDARLYPLKNDISDLGVGCEKADALYQDLARPYSVVILGMGPDGHTASWFPSAKGLEDALDPQSSRLVVPITAKPSPVTGAYLERATLGLAALSQADHYILLIAGEEKRAVYGAALKDPNSPFPIATALKAFSDKMTVYWAP